MTAPAVIYARFSPRPNAVECESIETQIDRCRAYCAAHGYEIVGEHADADMSGARADNRPGLQAAVDQACGEQAILVVYSLSRLARSVRDAITLAERIGQAKAHLASLTERIDTTSSMGRFTFTLFAALAQLEREQIAERTSDAMRRHQENGRIMSSRLPYGMKRDPNDPKRMVIDLEEQGIISLIVEMHEEGEKLRVICRRLRDEYGSACRGKPWNHKTIRRILDREGDDE